MPLNNEWLGRNKYAALADELVRGFNSRHIAAALAENNGIWIPELFHVLPIQQ